MNESIGFVVIRKGESFPALDLLTEGCHSGNADTPEEAVANSACHTGDVIFKVTVKVEVYAVVDVSDTPL